MIKYLGSKRLLLDAILAVAREAHPEARTFLDLFSGTSRVGHAAKRAGYRVISNDYLRVAHALARCYVAADRDKVEREVTQLLEEMRAAKPVDGWFTQTFCRDAMFLHPKNGARVEGMREWLAAKSLSPEVEGVLLTSLVEAADRVDSTCGVQMAYLKSWAPRAHNALELRFPDVLPGPGEARLGRAEDLVEDIEVDVAYLDPPYNQHSYLGNYHLWETLVAWDEPEVYGKARKRTECREKKSDFNRKHESKRAFAEVIERLKAEVIIVSFSDEGYLSAEELMTMLASRGEVSVSSQDYKRYVGAQIGIYNPSGDKVGKVSHLRNQEHIFVVDTRAEPDRTAYSAVDGRGDVSSERRTGVGGWERI